jgi:DNA-binding CsgD family transcriptional regulator
MYSSYVLKALEMLIATFSANEIMRYFAESSYEKLKIGKIAYFRVNAENRIELVSAYGEMFETLESYKYISRDRHLPVNEVIDSGRELLISSAPELAEKYEELKYLSDLPASLAVLPVKKYDITIGCVSFALNQPIGEDQLFETRETLRAFSCVLELSRVHEFSGIPSLIGINNQTDFVRERKNEIGYDNEFVMTTSLTSHFQDSPKFEFSERQIQIALLIASGATNAEIARELGYSPATIRYETVKLYERLRVKNRSQASSRIREIGIA